MQEETDSALMGPVRKQWTAPVRTVHRRDVLLHKHENVRLGLLFCEDADAYDLTSFPEAVNGGVLPIVNKVRCSFRAAARPRPLAAHRSPCASPCR